MATWCLGFKNNRASGLFELSSSLEFLVVMMWAHDAAL